MNHSILYGIARSFCGCQASFISGRQKQSIASNPPCTCRFIKWHHTASWDFLFYGKFSKACEFACPTSAFMILSHSRKETAYALMVKRLRRRPLTADSGVRFPMRVPKKAKFIDMGFAFFVVYNVGNRMGLIADGKISWHSYLCRIKL